MRYSFGAATGSNASRGRARGAGLGLAICRGIVEAHGGKIWVEHGSDRTTRFVVTLPPRTREPAAAGAATPSDS